MQCRLKLPEADLTVIDELARNEPVYDQAAYSWGRDVDEIPVRSHRRAAPGY